MTSAEAPAAGRWLKRHLIVGLVCWLLGLGAGLALLHAQDPLYFKLTLTEYPGRLARIQGSMLPAWALAATLYALITWPVAVALHRRWPARWPWLRMLGLDAVLWLLSLGPVLWMQPGLVDGLVAHLAEGLPPALDPQRLLQGGAPLMLTTGLGGVLLFDGICALRALSRARWGLPALGALLVGVGALAATAAVMNDGPEPGPTPSKPHVIIIASDSLRFDRLGVHGHKRPVSPHIDAFAREAADLTSMHVSTASTLESWWTLLSGRFPPGHGLRQMFIAPDEQAQAEALTGLLPRMLSEAGYLTAAVSDWAGNCFQTANPGFERNLTASPQTFDTLLTEITVWGHPVFPLYFDGLLGEVLLPEARGLSGWRTPEALTRTLLDSLDDAQDQERPFFGVVFYSTTHLPYRSGYPWDRQFTDPDYDGPHRHQISVTVHQLITDGFAEQPPEATVAHIRGLYDGAVARFDAQVGTILEGLDARGLADDTIVIVTSDHGEDLYDPGSTLGHGTNFFGGDQSTRIPFFIRVPEALSSTLKGQQINAVTRAVDLTPTLADLLKLPTDEGWAGVSLMPLLTGERADLDLMAFAETCYLFFPKAKAMVKQLTEAERSDLVTVAGAHEAVVPDPAAGYAMVLKPAYREAVVAAKDLMVRTRRWKLIRIPGRGGPILRLYDMGADPHQHQDLSRAHPAVVDRLQASLDAYRRDQAGSLRWPTHQDQ